MNANGETALHLAAWKGRTALCRVLMRTVFCSRFPYRLILMPFLEVHGANVNQANKRNETPVHFAARSGSLETVKLLLSAKGSLTKVGNNGTPVDVAHRSIAEAVQRSILFELLLYSAILMG